jgi:hypothetical protein
MRTRIAAFHNAQADALAELRAAIEQVRDADAATRRHALETLAHRQTPALAALEHESEQIRTDLAAARYDWSALREWALGESSRRGDSPMEIAATMRAYAFYQSGLVPGQRRLLREISLELAMAGEDAAAAQAAQPFMFFSPEPARVLLPDDLPVDLAGKVAAYQTKKSALKKELYDAVYKSDSAMFPLLRRSALKSLAEKQAPRLAELEPLAEDIRRGLAELPSPTKRRSTSSPLPPVLTARLDAVVRAGGALQKETLQKIEAVRADIAGEPIALSYRFEESGVKFTITPRMGRFVRSTTNQQLADQITARMREVENTMTEIASEFGRRFADLVNESESIRADAATALGQTNRRVVDAALASARENSALKESEDAFNEYRFAVFEPGLSPEQRRLLFGGAIEKLDLPLLRGEYQPTRRAATW